MTIEEKMTAKDAMRIRNKPTAEDVDNKDLSKCIDEALEKQIPKKPIDVCKPVVTWGLCPVCKGELNKLGGRPNRVFSSMNYCPDCGQRIDWSEEK